MKIENISATRGHYIALDARVTVLVELAFEGVPPETAIARVLALLGSVEAEQPAPDPRYKAVSLPPHLVKKRGELLAEILDFERATLAARPSTVAMPAEEAGIAVAASDRAVREAAEEAAAPEPGRRRRGNALGEPETKPETPAPTEGRRRRRSEGQSEVNPTTAPTADTAVGSPESSAPAVSSASTPGQPSRRRRSEGQSDAPLAAAATADPSTISASPAPASPEQPSRRRRSSVPAEVAPTTSAAGKGTTTSTATGSDISDADLSKAASEAARVLTPTVVRAYLDEFGVETTGKLKGEQRREFIDGLKAKLAEEGAK